ncbi:MAG: SpoVR family protein [Chloroflexi bacterium]|nr:SpoVR family protein [Chloroflexota bacterium]
MNPQDFRALEKATQEIWDIARRFGLDPFPTNFELVPAAIMYEFGAYGLPGRFSHWTHGRAYQQIKTMYDYGLSRIYELVINTNPAYAFLLENNSVLQNKVVVAHVLAHVDFFKHNMYFEPTNRQMLESASVNADRIRRYEFQHGKREVEEFLDAVLSIQEHVDPNLRIKRKTVEDLQRRPTARETTYDDLFYVGDEKRPEQPPRRLKVPPEPEKDLLLFVAEHARGLEDWQRDIIQIVRAEQLYFTPQMQTKVINEGWAAYWHARIMRELDLPSDEYVEFSRMHSAVLAPSRRQVNPYYVGMKMFEDIERRWDNPSEEERARGHQPGQGQARIFEVRELENDASFLRNYLTADLVEELDLYLYRLEGDKWVIVEKNWEKVRDAILNGMTNFGYPYIVVEDSDFNANRELFLRHCFEGQELDLAYAEQTLRFVHKLWGRTVHLETQMESKPIILSYDGKESRSRPAAA